MLTMEELGFFIYMDEIEKQQSADQNENDEEQTIEMQWGSKSFAKIKGTNP